MRLLIGLLLVTVAFAGCADTDSFVPAEADPCVVQSADDYSCDELPTEDPTKVEHIHDYWGGQDQLDIMDKSRSTTWNTVDGAYWILSFFPNDGIVIPQGTAFVEVDVTFAPGTQADNYGKVELWVKRADDNEPELVQEILSGDHVVIETEYDDADLPHQLLSAWEFQVRLYRDDAYGAYTGTTNVKVVAVKGLELQPFPAHPDHWDGGNITELPLVDAEGSYFQFTYTGTGNTNVRINPDEGNLVPQGADRVVLILTAVGDAPVGGVDLSYHAANTRNFTTIQPTETTGDTATYEIPIERIMTDGPYSQESLWEFLLTTQDQDPSFYRGSYTLSATVQRDG